MSTVNDNEAAHIPRPSLVLNIMPPTETHGIGDSFKEKPLSPHSSLENLSDICAVSSFSSFKTICKAWQKRAKTASTMNLDRGVEELEAKLEASTSKVESRTLHLTDSSNDDAPPTTTKLPQRFIEPKEIREAFAVFKLCDGNDDNFIELPALKLALEKLSVPQTHLQAKKFMAEICGQRATRMNFCQFLLIYAAILQSKSSQSA